LSCGERSEKEQWDRHRRVSLERGLASPSYGEPEVKNNLPDTWTCVAALPRPYARPEVGGRRCRQPGQVRKEAATTISCRVVGFHHPKHRAQRRDCSAIASSAQRCWGAASLRAKRGRS